MAMRYWTHILVKAKKTVLRTNEWSGRFVNFFSENLVADMFSVSMLFYCVNVSNRTRISKICVWHENFWQRANVNCSKNNIHNQCHVCRSIFVLAKMFKPKFYNLFNLINDMFHFVIWLNSSCKQPRWHSLWPWDRFTGLGFRLLASIGEGSISRFLCATRTTQTGICYMVGETIR